MTCATSCGGKTTRATRPRSILQAVDALGGEPSSPVRDPVSRHVHALRDLTIGASVRRQQHQLRAHHDAIGQGQAARSPPQLKPSLLVNLDRYRNTTHAITFVNLAATPSTRWNLRRAALRQVHALVSRTIRFSDQGADRRDTLKLAAVASLASRLFVAGVGKDATIIDDVVHARRLAAEPHDESGASLLSLVAVQDQLRGDYHSARALMAEALQIMRGLLGDEHPQTLKLMSNLALVLLQLGDRATARDLNEQILSARQGMVDEDDSASLISMNNFGRVLQEQGDLTAAATLFERVLESGRKLGEDHPVTLASMNNLALVRWEQGAFQTARHLHEQVLEARRRTLGEEHPDTLQSINNLAAAMYSQDEVVGALALLNQVVKLRRRVLGEEHPDTLESMNNLAATLQSRGDLHESQALNEEVLAGRRAVLGEAHPLTLDSMHNLAIVLRDQGKLAGSRSLLDQVVEVRQRTLGQEHGDTIDAMADLAVTLHHLGDKKRVRELRKIVDPHARRAQKRNPGWESGLSDSAPAVRRAVSSRHSHVRIIA